MSNLQVVTNMSDYHSEAHTGVGLGNFDGLHIGHMALIGTLINECRLNGLSPVVYTFNKHTGNMLRKNLYNPLITTNEQKKAILGAMDIDTLCYQEFNETFSHLSPEEFVRNILVERLQIRLAVVGFNYRFGYMGRGDTELLKKYGDQWGFKTIVVHPVKVNSEIVSSTLIREYIKKGKMERVFQLLGRYFSLCGKVVDGRKIGRTLGFPTANILAHEKMVVPAHGVYITKTRVGNRWHNGITNVGIAPTIREGHVFSIETHLLDYNEDIYGQEIEVCFVRKLRGEKRFETVEVLKKQVTEDILETKRYWDILR